MVMRSGGEILVDGLLSLGARHGFCVPGESYLAVLDGFYQARDRFSLITCRHEGGASYMAEAYGKVSGSVGICFVTRGPGASNAMVGVHTAYQDSTPMLLFVGQVERGFSGRESFQELSYESVYGSVAKGVIRIDRADRVVELLLRAWSLCLSGRPGPVVVELPEDMLRERVSAIEFRPPVISHPSASVESMERVGDILRDCRRPVFVVGGAGWSEDAKSSLELFAERHGALVLTSFRRQDSIDNDHGSYVGDLSVVVSEHILEALERSDCVVIVSSRFGEISSGSYKRLPVPYGDKKLVHVHCSGDELNRVYGADAVVVSTAGSFFESLLSMDGLPEYWSAEEVSYFRESYCRSVELADGSLMSHVSCYLRDNLGADSIIACGAGNYTVWGQRHYYYHRWRTCLACTNGSMGYGVPAAIAAKVYNPESPVVALAGDGCFLMTGQELATCVYYDIAIIILVINNSSYATIRSHQERDYPGHRIATDLCNPDFADYARSFGAFGATVSQASQFGEAFSDALASGKVAVIDIKLT